MSVKEIIETLRKELNIKSNAALSKEIGVPATTLQSAIDRDSLSYEIRDKITKSYGISASWIQTGIGEMFTRKVNEPQASYGKFNSNFFSANIMMVPMVGQLAHAGYMSGYGDEEYVGDLPKFPFPVDRNYKGNYMAFEVSGDSMDDGSMKSLPNGVILLGREVGRQHWMNKLHINRYNFIIVHKTEGILVKRIIKHDVENGILTLHSLNHIYDDFEVHLDDIVQIFNVVKSARDESL